MRKPILCLLAIAIALSFPLAACCPLPLRRLALPAVAPTASQAVGPQLPTGSPEATATLVVDPTVEALVNAYGVSATGTDSDRFAALAAHEDGEKLIAMTDADASGNIRGVTGAIWISPEDEALLVYSGADGLPEQAVVGDIILLFSNYTSDSADLALVTADGSFQIIRDMPVDAEDLSQLRDLQHQVGDRGGSHLLSKPSYRSSNLAPSQKLRIAALLVRVASCLIEVAKSHLVLPLLVKAILPCASALVSSLALVTDNELMMATSLYLDEILCVDLPAPLRDPLACVAFVLDMAGLAASQAEERLRAQEQTVAEAEGELGRVPADRPDLVIVGAGTSMRGYSGGCVTEYSPLETQVCVDNQGTAPATAFVVQAGDLTWQIGGLAPGEQRCVEAEGSALGPAVVDAHDEVIESDEANNSANFPIPTPPALCTPAP